jgi:ATP-binding cassette subfamily B protein
MNQGMIKLLAKYYRPHMGLFLADMGAAALLAVSDLFYPMITRAIINDYVPNRRVELLIGVCAGLFGIFAIKYALNYFVLNWGHVMGAYEGGYEARPICPCAAAALCLF